MSSLNVNPFTQFNDLAGRPLDNGKVYVGQANLDPKDNPIDLFWDQAMTIAAVQPIPTLGGILFNDNAPGMIYADVDDFSVRVLDKKGRQIFFVPSMRQANLLNIGKGIPDSFVATESGETQRTVNNSLIRTVASIAALSAIPNPNPDQIVLVKGIGAGQFRYFDGSYLPSNGGTIVDANAIGKWIRVDQAKPRIEWFGGIGDGVTNCTSALQACLDACGTCYLQANSTYLLNGAITLKSNDSIHGIGRDSVLLLNFNTSAFIATATLESLYFGNFWIKSAVKRNTSSYIFDLSFGNVRSTFENIWAGNEVYDVAIEDYTGGFYSSGSASVCDTISFINCWLHRINGTGFNLGFGSSVWFFGGRCIGLGSGTNLPTEGSTGIKLNGGMGGLWLYGIDCIDLDFGMVQDQSNGSGTNREVFMQGAAFDGCASVGYHILDSACKVFLSNSWFCSSGTNILLGVVASSQLIFQMVGGIVYNANIKGHATGNIAGVGLNVSSGKSIIINGVEFHENGNNSTVGRHLIVDNSLPSWINVTGCQFTGITPQRDLLQATQAVMYTSNISTRVPVFQNQVVPPKYRVGGNIYTDDSLPNLAIAVQPSGTNYTYVDAYDCNLYMVCTTGSYSATINGVVVAKADAGNSASVKVQSGDVINVTYSGDFNWVFTPTS